MFLFAIITATMFAVAFNAWRLGNERRDVAPLGMVSGVSGVGAVATDIL